MSSQDPRNRGDPASRSESSFWHALKAVFGKRGRPPTRRPRDVGRSEGSDWAQAVRPEASEPSEEPARQPERPGPSGPETEPSIPITDVEAGRMAVESIAQSGRLASSGRTIDLTAAEREMVQTIELEDIGAAEEMRPESSGGDRAGPAAVDLDNLHHPSPDVRRKTLAVLGERPEDAPVVAVAARLQDPTPEVRREAVAVLEGMKEEAVLLLLLDAMEDPSEDVRRSAREAIRSRHSSSVVELLRRELTIPARRRVSARALADLGELDELVDAGEADPDTRWAVREALDDAGATAGLIHDLSSDSADRRRITAERLGAMRVREAVEPLIDRLQDPDPGVRIKAAGALGRIGDQRAVHALKRSLIWDPDARVVVAIGNGLRELREAATGRTVTV